MHASPLLVPEHHSAMATCDPAQQLTRGTQPSALTHIHAQSDVGRNGLGDGSAKRPAHSFPCRTMPPAHARGGAHCHHTWM